MAPNVLFRSSIGLFVLGSLVTAVCAQAPLSLGVVDVDKVLTNYPKAIEVLQKGIDKGQMEPGALAFAQLHLGMAQYKAGKKDDARKTWSTIKADNGAGWLARAWTALSRT